MNVPLTPIRFLRYAGEQFAGDLAIVCGDQRFTYAQFADRAARLAGALRAQGARSGDRVAFLSTNCHRLLEAYYGVLEADCVLLPLNVRLAPAELSYVLNDSGAQIPVRGAGVAATGGGVPPRRARHRTDLPARWRAAGRLAVASQLRGS